MKNKEISKILLEKKAVKLNFKEPFKYTSGMLSPIYVDNRILVSYPKEREIIVKEFKALINQFSDSKDLVLAGTATAAIPWATFMAQEMGLPMAYVRPKPKEHGAGKQVEGELKKGCDVVVVEDLISTGGSSIQSAEALRREYEANVIGVVAIFSYTTPKSIENFKKSGLELKYLTDFETTVKLAAQTGYIKDKEKAEVLKWKDLGWDWAKEVGLE